jgi:palmitoyltransferase
VWVNNCIGHGNYRAFALMTFYLTAACLHALLLLLSMDAHLVQASPGLGLRLAS